MIKKIIVSGIFLFGWIALPVHALEKIDIFLIIGQSNAQGAGNQSESVVPNPNTVYQFYNNSIVQGSDPVGNAVTGSAWPAFGKKYNELTGRKVLLVPSAAGGTGLSPYADGGYGHWSVNGSLFNTSVSNLDAAVKMARKNGYIPVIKGVLWAQGENDATNISGGTAISQDTAEQLLKDLINAYRKKYRRDLPFYIFQLGAETRTNPDGSKMVKDAPGYLLMRSMQENVDLDDPYTNIVFTDAYTFAERGFLYDGIHYNQTALNEMGTVGAMNVVNQQVNDPKVSKNVIYSVPGNHIRFAGYVDLNLDARADIVYELNNGQAMYWTMNNKSIVSGGNIGVAKGAGWVIRGFGDFDANGHQDIVWQNNSTGDVKISFLDGTALLSDQDVAGVSSIDTVAAIADFDNDGKADLLTRTAQGQATLLLMNSAQVLNTRLIGGQNGAPMFIKGVGDFNGDGSKDIVWRGTLADGREYTMMYLLNQGSFLSAKTVAPWVPLPWDIKGVGDFNDDGKDDLLWQNNNGQATIWTMNGSILVKAQLVGKHNGPTWQIKQIGDMDGDGKDDFVWQNEDSVMVVFKPILSI